MCKTPETVEIVKPASSLVTHTFLISMQMVTILQIDVSGIVRWQKHTTQCAYDSFNLQSLYM